MTDIIPTKSVGFWVVGVKVSSRAHYGLRAMTQLSKAFGSGPLSLTEISRTEQLPLAYLEQGDIVWVLGFGDAASDAATRIGSRYGDHRRDTGERAVLRRSSRADFGRDADQRSGSGGRRFRQ